MNARERRVLLVLSLVLIVGGAVRLVSRHRPRWTPGVATARPDPVERPETGVDGAALLDSLFVGGRLDVNAAGTTHLELLPGIGPTLAARVVEVRRSRGGFGSVDELIAVPGIGPKTLERLRPYVCVRAPDG